jgi:acyl carrier protein
MEELIRQVMADVLDLDVKAIDESTCQDNTASWDSLNHINLVAALEQEFDVAFDVSEMESMLSFSDIVEVLRAKG